MKEQLYFIKWCGRKIVESIKSWDSWMWAWMATCFFGSAWANSTLGSLWQQIAQYSLTTIVIGYWICYAIAYTSLKKAWQSYQDEKQKVINILGEKNEFSANGR